MNHTIEPLGDQSLFVQVGEDISEEVHLQVRGLCERLEMEDLPWVLELVPSYTGVAIYYDATQLVSFRTGRSPYREASERISSLAQHADSKEEGSGRTIHIPVCYGGDYGPDLSEVATYNGLSEEEVIERHVSREYLVYMLGFAPGFPFLGGMDESIASPRKEEPRVRIPAGSVGIAGSQTGVYPLESPGGWQLIGRTPLRLFLPEQDPPTYLRAGDRVTFYSISTDAFEEWEGEG